jgi:hypothetical protein
MPLIYDSEIWAVRWNFTMSLMVRTIGYHFYSLVEDIHNNETEEISMLERKCALKWNRYILIQYARITSR